MEILSKILVKRHELADSQSRKQKRNRQPGRIHGEKQHPARDGRAVRGKNENGTKDGADARGPAESEGEAQQKAAPDAGLRGLGAQVDVAIEPARHRRTKKTNQREREKVYRAESGKERSLPQQREDSKPSENHAENHPDANREFPESAREMQAKEKDQCTRNWSKQRAVLKEEGTDGAGRGAKRNEYHGETRDKRRRRGKQSGARNLTLTQLLHADAGKHRDIAGHQRKHTRGKKRNQPGQKRSRERDIGWSHVPVLPSVSHHTCNGGNRVISGIFPRPLARFWSEDRSNLFIRRAGKEKETLDGLKRIDDRCSVWLACLKGRQSPAGCICLILKGLRNPNLAPRLPFLPRKKFRR